MKDLLSWVCQEMPRLFQFLCFHWCLMVFSSLRTNVIFVCLSWSDYFWWSFAVIYAKMNRSSFGDNKDFVAKVSSSCFWETCPWRDCLLLLSVVPLSLQVCHLRTEFISGYPARDFFCQNWSYHEHNQSKFEARHFVMDDLSYKQQNQMKYEFIVSFSLRYIKRDLSTDTSTVMTSCVTTWDDTVDNESHAT